MTGYIVTTFEKDGVLPSTPPNSPVCRMNKGRSCTW